MQDEQVLPRTWPVTGPRIGDEEALELDGRPLLLSDL